MKAQLIPGDKRIATVVTALALFLVLSCATGHTLEIPDYNTSIQVTAGNRTGVFLDGGRNFLGQNSVVDRFEQFLLADGKTQFNKDLSMTIKLRGFIDNVFDVQGGSHWSADPKAIHALSNSFALKYNDVLREAYFDYNLGQLPDEDGKLFARIGKQQVVWGKADGFRLLDLINPFDFREPFYPNFEDVRIPLWMINLNYTLPRQVLQNASLQLIGDPFYQQDTFPPPLVSPWSFRGFDEFQHTANTVGFRVLPNLYDRDFEPATTLKNWSAGARWSHTIQNFSYTVNYFYGWTSLPHAKPQFVPVSSLDPLGFLYNVSPDRVHKIGGSFDYNAYKIPLLNIENVVFRGEFLGTINNQFYGNVQPKTLVANYKRNTADYVLGIDKYVYGIPFLAPETNTQTLVSGQILQDFIPGSNPQKEGLTNPGDAKLNAVKTSLTLFLQNTSMEQRLTSECLFFYSDAGEWWFRPRAIYDVSDNITAELGGQFFIGHSNDLVGEFARKGMQEIFIQLKYQIL